MIEIFRLRLREWLGINRDQNNLHQALMDHGAAVTQDFNNLQGQINKLREEVGRLTVDRYVPPSQPEPERKVIKTQTFKQFSDIIEREYEECMRSEEDAIR